MELSNPSHPVLSGLLRKRQEIATEIDNQQALLHALVSDIDAVDATIRMFAPDLDITTVCVRTAPKRHCVRPGDMSKLLMTLLRENGQMSHRQLTLKVMEHRGLNVADKALRVVMRNRVGASLRGLKKRGTLETSEGAKGLVLWALAEHPRGGAL